MEKERERDETKDLKSSSLNRLSAYVPERNANKERNEIISPMRSSSNVCVSCQQGHK